MLLPPTVAQSSHVRFSLGPTDFLLINTHSGGGSDSHSGGPRTQEHIVVPVSGTASVRKAMAAPMAWGRPLTAGRSNLTLSGDRSVLMGLAPEREHLERLDRPPEVVRIVQVVRAPSTSASYSKWFAFQRWCVERDTDPKLCPLPLVLTFLQLLVDKRLALSTVKTYAVAISSCHEGAGERSVFAHLLVKRFLKVVRRQQAVTLPMTPQWDSPLVLCALGNPPFQLLTQISLKYLTLETALLLALTLAKRISDLCALSASPS